MSAPTPQSATFSTDASQLQELDSARYACLHELLEITAQEHAQSIAVEIDIADVEAG